MPAAHLFLNVKVPSTCSGKSVQIAGMQQACQDYPATCAAVTGHASMHVEESNHVLNCGPQASCLKDAEAPYKHKQPNRFRQLPTAAPAELLPAHLQTSSRHRNTFDVQGLPCRPTGTPHPAEHHTTSRTSAQLSSWACKVRLPLHT